MKFGMGGGFVHWRITAHRENLHGTCGDDPALPEEELASLFPSALLKILWSYVMQEWDLISPSALSPLPVLITIQRQLETIAFL